MQVYVRRMRQEDTRQVAEIDREAFPDEWPPPNFKRELNNQLAHYLVACDADEVVDEPEEKVTPHRKGLGRVISWVTRLFGRNRLFDNKRLMPIHQNIIGFTGFWVMADEAHITTIASRKDHRRQGIGELLLISTIELARKLRARVVTLEVRASNTAAQSLYYKYGFSQVGVRRGYYVDNREDGIVMSTEDMSSAPFQARLKQLKEAHSKKWRTNDFEVGH